MAKAIQKWAKLSRLKLQSGYGRKKSTRANLQVLEWRQQRPV